METTCKNSTNILPKQTKGNQIIYFLIIYIEKKYFKNGSELKENGKINLFVLMDKSPV